VITAFELACFGTGRNHFTSDVATWDIRKLGMQDEP
jgi:hypothetical protein